MSNTLNNDVQEDERDLLKESARSVVADMRRVNKAIQRLNIDPKALTGISTSTLDIPQVSVRTDEFLRLLSPATEKGAYSVGVCRKEWGDFAELCISNIRWTTILSKTQADELQEMIGARVATTVES